MAFAIFGVIGMVWAFFFYRWFRDDPRDNPKVNAAELKLLEENRRLAHGHPKVPWHLAGRRPVVLLALQYACLSYGWYFYITWLPTYLRQGRSLTPFMSALLGILPLFLGGCGSFFSGLIAEPVTRWTGSVAKGRRGHSASDLDQVARPSAGHDRHGVRQLLQRPGDAGCLGRLHGRGREVRGHTFRDHEYDGEFRRRSLSHDHRVYSERHA
jgi:hypothetical protein